MYALLLIICFTVILGVSLLKFLQLMDHGGLILATVSSTEVVGSRLSVQ
jgi:hypothetical protein